MRRAGLRSCRRPPASRSRFIASGRNTDVGRTTVLTHKFYLIRSVLNSVMEFNVKNPQAESNSDLELTILMPCLNEAETIGICIAKAQEFLQRAGVKGEVLIADNGSTDGSRAIATNLGARVIPVP